MVKNVSTTLFKSVLLTAAAVLIALGTNAVRGDGIPPIAEVPYDIFSACMDADAVSTGVSADALSAAQDTALLVDARPTLQFTAEHAEGALNIPYSALFGASETDVEKVRKAAAEHSAIAVLVYGAYEDPEQPGVTVDFGKPLADQLTEAGIQNVRYVEGGLAEMKKQGTRTVKGK